MFHSSTRSTCAITRLLRTCNAQHRGNQSQRGRQVSPPARWYRSDQKNGKVLTDAPEMPQQEPPHVDGRRGKRCIAAVLLGVLLGSPCESTDGLDHHAILLRAEVQRMKLVGVRPRRKALPKAWAMKSVATSRKVSPPTSKQDRHVPTD